MNVAFHCCSLSINRRVYHSAKGNVPLTLNEKRGAIMMDLAICVGIPILCMILSYIPDGHRFNILEDFGCQEGTYPTWVAFVLQISWPLAIAAVSSVYSILNLRALDGYRQQYKEHRPYNSDWNPSFYFRLMCLSATDIVITIPFTVWVIVHDREGGIRPWISWDDTHYNFSHVLFIPATLWKANHIARVGVEFSRWSIVMVAIFYFGYFGFTTEAR